MKIYRYTFKQSKYMVAKVLCPVYILGIVLSIIANLPLNLLILFIAILGIFFSLICIWWHKEIRPDIPGQLIIDEKNMKLKIYRTKMENKKFNILNIKEIRYARDGGLYIRTDKRVWTYGFSISTSEEKDFERNLLELGRKYDFPVLVLWKRRDVKTGKKLSEIEKERLKHQKGD